MKLYNTLSRKLEEFKPIKDKQVAFYHCGPTVYWVQHIGNLRAMTWADFIRRSLVYLGYHVKFVRNYTDVGHLTSDQDQGEDKMEKAARNMLFFKCKYCGKITPSFIQVDKKSFKTIKLINNYHQCNFCGKMNLLENNNDYFYRSLEITPTEIANKYIKIFEDDTKALNILEPDYKPRASQYIEQMQDMIQTLLDKKYAYITSLAVVYDVSKFPKYNDLNHQKLELNKQGAGKGQVDDPEKKHFADFNLWVFKKGVHENALQTWDSPWGIGFPGWHIECSVMAKALLGETIDIHMGGVEHISVHHTNEIAQSEAANGVPFVHYWIHNEHLNVNDEKMAKSAGTGFTLKEVTDHGFEPLALRYFFLSAHYRSKQNFTWEALKSAQETLNKLRRIVSDLKSDKSDLKPIKNSFKKDFEEAIANDFQIPQALAVMWNMIKSDLSSKEKLKLLFNFDQVFGLNLDQVAEEIIPDEIEELAKKRQTAKDAKDYKKADEIRNVLHEKGYEVEDEKGRYRIKKLGF